MTFQEQKTLFLALGMIYQALGMPAPRKNPQRAAALLLERGRFPVPTHLILGRRVFLMSDVEKLALRLGNDEGMDPPAADRSAATQRRGRGRPSNADLAARAASLSKEVGHD